LNLRLFSNVPKGWARWLNSGKKAIRYVMIQFEIDELQ
jgi:hypothetical protein